MAHFPKIDFIHVGYHKTASTWLQKKIFPGVPALLICNDARLDLERALFDPFILADPFRYDKDEFLAGFGAAIERQVGDVSKYDVIGISEENLSGDVVTGKEAKALADRLFATFGPTRILIVIRNQVDMLLSIYSNYVLHSGICTLPGLLRDLNLEGMRVLNKLCYSGLIEYYRELYGANNVHVEFFENLTQDRQPLRRLFGDIGIKGELPTVDISAENRGRSLIINAVARQLNRVGISNGYARHLPDIDRRDADRRYVRDLFPDGIAMWRADNKRLAEGLGFELPESYAL